MANALMTKRRNLLDDSFAAFIDENATGIGLPASERRYRRPVNPFAKLTRAFGRIGELMSLLADAFVRLGETITKGLHR